MRYDANEQLRLFSERIAAEGILITVVSKAKTENLDRTGSKPLNEDGGPGSGNFGHEGRKGEVGGSAPGDEASERCGKIASRLKEIEDEQAKCLAEMMASPSQISPELIHKAQALSTESASLKDELETLNPNSKTNISKRMCEEGHPTEKQILDSLPDEWKNTYDFEGEQTYAQSLSPRIASWSGEGYQEMKGDFIIQSAIEKSSAKWNKGELYRGMSISAEELDSLKPGGTLQMNGLSSWSSDISPAMSFATIERNPVLIIDKTSGTRNALPIAQLSVRSFEKEVIYGKDQRFTVRSVSTKEVSYMTSANGNVADFSKEAARKVTVIEVEAE